MIYCENVELLARVTVFSTNSMNGIAPKNCARDLSSSVQTLDNGTRIGMAGIASLAGIDVKNAQLLAWIFQDKFYQYKCVCPGPVKVSKPRAMGHA